MKDASAMRRLLFNSVCAACRSARPHVRTRPFSSASVQNAGDTPAASPGGLSGLASNMNRSRQSMQTQADSRSPSNMVEADMKSLFGSSGLYGSASRDDGEIRETEEARNRRETYYFHVYATKHNTHITICTPAHEPMKKLSLSTGNIGFKKANRGTYDAAYQLVSFMLSRIVEQGNLAEMKRIEVVLRGFGVGREAVTKAILGQEGSMIRKRIVAVTDATRLKFGGTRSPKPRRLG